MDLTTVGIGTWAIGGGDWAWGWGHQDVQEAVAGICRGVDLGVNWIDTAAVYGDGASEKLVGRALGEMSDGERPVVATKCGWILREDGTVFGRLNRESVMEECEASLRRLGVEAIDLYQMHWPDPDADIEEGWEAMVALKEQGKVRHIGVSNANVAQIKRLQRIHPAASLQPPYHMMARGVEDVLRLVADRHDRPMAQVAVAWVLRREEVTSAIVGVRKPSHIEETAGAADWDLEAEDLAVIHTALAEREAEE